MSLHITANLPQIPRDFETETFNLSMITSPAKLIQFPAPVDVYVGICESCGLAVYQADEHRTEPSLACFECLAEERSWKKTAAPVVTRKAA